jgi:hypothetical protein
MDDLIIVALILANLFAGAHFISMDKEWGHVIGTSEHHELRLKHGLKNTEVVVCEGSRKYYFNQYGERCEFR